MLSSVILRELMTNYLLENRNSFIVFRQIVFICEEKIIISVQVKFTMQDSLYITCVNLTCNQIFSLWN